MDNFLKSVIKVLSFLETKYKTPLVTIELYSDGSGSFRTYTKKHFDVATDILVFNDFEELGAILNKYNKGE
jgi:hypothetical protein